MKIINKLMRVILEILTGAIITLTVTGIVSGLAYLVGLLGNKIVFVLLGIAAICVFGKIGKDALETIELHKKYKEEIKEFKEKYKE